MSKPILYTTGCPKCQVLSKKLSSAGVDYEVCDDLNIMESKEMTLMPMLEVDGELMDFTSAVSWVNNIAKE